MRTQHSPRKTTPGQYALLVFLAAVGMMVALLDYLSQNRPPDRPTSGYVITPAASAREPIIPLPLSLDLDSRKVALGEALYHDTRLSGDNTISCATCHDLAYGGTDRAAFSTGIGGARGQINAPTTFNAALNFSQFWDGRAKTLEEQASGPVHNPAEMGSSWPEVVPKLNADEYYPGAFEAIYADGITGENIVDAIATFERSLITPDSRFDRFLRGDAQAITADEQEGYRLFKDLGCIGCHQGVNIGGNLYQTIGVMDNYFAHRPIEAVDLGRYNVTGNAWNRHQFKVPTLRNIAITYPYLHDGSVESLEEVLAIMADSQLGRPLTSRQTDLIIRFLHTLTGTYRGQPL